MGEDKVDATDLESVKAAVMAKRAVEMTYTFQNAYNGISHTSEAPAIFGKLLKIRMLVGSLAAERAPGVMFPVKSSKELMQKLCQAMADEGILAPVIAQEVVQIPDIEFTGKNGLQPGTGVHVKSTVRFIASDGSFIDAVGSGHGLDRDDKAGGKASTYAYKDAVLKGLGIPEKDLVDTDDESGQGADRTKKSQKVPKVSQAAVVAATVPTSSETAPVPDKVLTVDEYLALVNAAKDGPQLLAAAGAAKKNLDDAGQKIVGAAYRAMKTKLGV